jgi:hypothetical protein
MTSTLRTSMLAAAIVASPLIALAQGNNPTGNLGSNDSVTATPPTANSPASGLHAADANATPQMTAGAERNQRVPGATGQTVVPGTTSTIAGDRQGTLATKTGTAAASDGSGK